MRRRLPHSGTERTRCRFLLFRMEIGNERRWLEKACWIAKCYKGAYTGMRRWLPVRWLDEEKAAYANIDVYSEQAIVEAVACLGKKRGRQ